MAHNDERASNLAMIMGVGILLIFFIAIVGPVSWAHREPEMRESMPWPLHDMGKSTKKVYTNPKGLKYSPGNTLVVKKTSDNKAAYAAYQELVDTVLLPYDMKDGSPETVMYPIWEEYFPQIGANGLLNTLHSRWKKLWGGSGALHARHRFGEWLAMKANGQWRDMIEVAARPDLGHAQLHGAVWHAVLSRNADTYEEMIDFVETELCFFRDEPGLFDIYQSCAHGVGHGLGMLFPPEESFRAAEVCALAEDYDFAGSCATGIYMTLMEPLPPFRPQYMNSLGPCDRDPFPANCYRFKGHDLGQLHRAGIQYPCYLMPDRYHEVGCVWGTSFHDSHRHHWDIADEFCAHYDPDESELEDKNYAMDLYLACLDGLWTRFWQFKETNAKKIEVCMSFKHPAAQRHCARFIHKDKNTRVDGKGAWYNKDFLEKYAELNPDGTHVRPHAAPWPLDSSDEQSSAFSDEVVRNEEEGPASSDEIFSYDEQEDD
mmetsp:Transcript_19347/g.74295  ORF Transcript_19347/g.74295 Transcript_19347/m.74295 type:complete len:487 (-) Transcript_19347:45-1505(-)